MALVISRVVAEALRKAAGGKDVEEFLAELIAERLDPPERVELYLRLYEKFFKEAEALYEGATLCKLARSTGAPWRRC